jgi:hypothetical protein
MSRLFRSGHQLQFIIGTDVWPVLTEDEQPVEDEPEDVLQFNHRHGYEYVFGKFSSKGYVDIMSKEDGRIVGYLNLHTAEAVTFVSEARPPELITPRTIEFDYFLMALQRCRESVRFLAATYATEMVYQLPEIMKTIAEIAVGEWFAESTSRSYQTKYATEKLRTRLTTHGEIEAFFRRFFPRGARKLHEKIQQVVADNLYCLEHAIRWMETPKLRLRYQNIGQMIYYRHKLQENVRTGQYQDDTPCEVVFPACVFAGTNEIVKQKSVDYNMMVCVDPDARVTPKPPPSATNVDETDENAIIEFLRDLYTKLRHAMVQVEVTRMFVDPVTLRQYLQNECDIDTIARQSTMMQFYPLIKPITHFDLVLIFYKPFGSMLYSVELEKRYDIFTLKLYYVADQSLYSTAQQASIAMEIAKILRQLIKGSAHCGLYTWNKHHSPTGCKDCEEAQKNCNALINMLSSITTKHYFHERPGSYPDIMEGHLTSESSFSRIY